MKKVLVVASTLAVFSGALSALPVLAQRSDNPNLKMFYMARQQIQITDDAPAVNDMRSNPAAAQSAAAAAQAAQGALPRAGFMSNMGAYHGSPMSGALPTVNNGLPKALPQTATGLPGQPQGQSAGNAGKLKIKKASPAAARPTQVVAKTYRPYATTPQQSGGSGSLLNSSTSVNGSVLHWNRKH